MIHAVKFWILNRNDFQKSAEFPIRLNTILLDTNLSSAVEKLKNKRLTADEKVTRYITMTLGIKYINFFWIKIILRNFYGDGSVITHILTIDIKTGNCCYNACYDDDDGGLTIMRTFPLAYDISKNPIVYKTFSRVYCGSARTIRIRRLLYSHSGA